MHGKNFYPMCCFRMEYLNLNANLTSVISLLAYLFLQKLSKKIFLLFLFTNWYTYNYIYWKQIRCFIFLFSLLGILIKIDNINCLLYLLF